MACSSILHALVVYCALSILVARRVDMALAQTSIDVVDNGSVASPPALKFTGRLSHTFQEEKASSTGHADETSAPFDDMTCPGSESNTHASAKIVVLAKDADCKDVRAEIGTRAGNIAKWHDPGNMYSNGVITYKPFSVSERSWVLHIGRTTPRFKFFDLMTFTLKPQKGGCLIKGCSKSQGYSVLDFHTNYCNMFNLICGSLLGCSPIANDFVIEELAAWSSCGQRDYAQCLKYKNVSYAPDATEKAKPVQDMLTVYRGWFIEQWTRFAVAFGLQVDSIKASVEPYLASLGLDAASLQAYAGRWLSMPTEAHSDSD